MTPLAVACWSVLLLAAPARAESHSAVELEPVVTVFTHYEQPHSEITEFEMKTEVAALMEPVGVDFEWRSLDESKRVGVVMELVVVTFKGHCDAEEAAPAGWLGSALGWSHVSEGAILPFSDVDCDKIRRLVIPAVSAADKRSRELSLGRALGRVLAHEFYHIFGNTTRHAGSGVAKPFYTALELTTDNLEFQQRDAALMRQGKLRRLIEKKHTSGSWPAGGQ